MIQTIKDLPLSVVGIEISGKVTKTEYESVVVPLLEESSKLSGKINYLVVLKANMGDIELGVWWEDFKMAIKHFSNWNKIAIVTDQEWVVNMTDTFAFMFPGKTKGFKLKEYEIAVNWLSTLD